MKSAPTHLKSYLSPVQDDDVRIIEEPIQCDCCSSEFGTNRVRSLYFISGFVDFTFNLV